MKPWLKAPILLLSLALAGGSATAVEQERGEPQSPTVPAPAANLSRMAWFYIGPTGAVGHFPGQLVCYDTELLTTAAGAAACQREGEVYALAFDDGSTIHPLVPGTELVSRQLQSAEFRNEPVVVMGKYYSTTGMILAQKILPGDPDSEARVDETF